MAGFRKWEVSERFTEPNASSLPYFMIKLLKEKKTRQNEALISIPKNMSTYMYF